MSSRKSICNALGREDGQTMSEYALTLALVTLAVVGVITVLSTAIVAEIGHVGTTIAGLVP
jgi:Flp pilus assembly pilin Flp